MSGWSDDEDKPAAKASDSRPKLNGDWEDEEDTPNSSERGRGGFRGGRGGSGHGGGGDRPSREPRDDDWICPDEECAFSNFGKNSDCFKCHTANPNPKPARAPREARDDDWICPDEECAFSNFGKNSDCFKCHTANPNPKPARAPREARDDDWICPDEECAFSNFGRNNDCFKCHTANPNPKPARAPREARDDDWICPSEGCNANNFGFRNDCFKCQAANPNPKADGEKPREIYYPPEPSTDENVMFGAGIAAGINFDQFDQIQVQLTGNGSQDIKQISTFEEACLREILLANVKRCGYTRPTPIQKNAIPIIMAKRDLMGCAQTGSGKTAAFILPILNMIMKEETPLCTGQPQCLIVAPTRELVIQIFEEARKFANSSWVKVCLAYGGTASRHQSDNITKGCHVLVATPGRLKDFVGKSLVTFQSLKFLVLDEADRMLDMGFKPSIDEIATHATFTKENVQTLMFSATFPQTIQVLAGEFLRDYIFLAVGIVGGASTDVDQTIIEVAKLKKRTQLKEILKQYSQASNKDRILVFVETKKSADFLASFLSETKMSTISIHGDRLQREREEALRDFRNGKHKILIATSVAARGLDIQGVTHVVNFDLPKEIQDYVHRIGRTGRVGNRGKATSFYDPERDSTLAGHLARILKDSNQAIPEFLGEPCAEDENTGKDYGGVDIRGGAVAGQQQEDDADW